MISEPQERHTPDGANGRRLTGNGVARRRVALAAALACVLTPAPAVALGASQPKGAHAAPSARRHKPAHARHRRTAPAKPSPAAPAPAKIAACADADLSPLPTNAPRVAAAALCLVNQVRAVHGVNALAGNVNLAQAAQRHSDDMSAANYFGHDGPAGDTTQSRIRSSGYVTSASTGYDLGELVDYGLAEQATARAIVAKWSVAPEFVATLLDPVYRDAGIAVAAFPPAAWANGQPGATYTVDFGGIAAPR